MMTEGTKKKMKAIQEMKLTNKPTINEVVLEMRALRAEIQTLKNEVKNATEVVNMLKLLVMDLAELVSIEVQTAWTEHKGVAATLQEIIEKERSESVGGTMNGEPVLEITFDDYIPTYAESHSESEGGNKQQAVDFSEVAQEPIKALDTIPEDEFEFDFFDTELSEVIVSPKEELSTQSWTDTSITTTAVAGDVVNVPSESGILNTTDAVASATGDIEEFDPLASL